jgi:hypothetical protein
LLLPCMICLYSLDRKGLHLYGYGQPA